MEYSVSQLAKLSGVSARTLRYYDEIDLLAPKRLTSKGYRVYGQDEVDRLQQILLYRALDISLEEIKRLIYSKDFDLQTALKSHLLQLTRQKVRLESIIESVEATIQASKGDKIMTNEEKFTAFKQHLIQDNETKYGQEIRQKYGEDAVVASNDKLSTMLPDHWQAFEALGQEINDKLTIATRQGNPKSQLAQEVCDLHRQWLTLSWPKGQYDAQKHYNISLMYVYDDRFKTYYDAIEPGAADFLHASIKIYTNMAD